VLLTAEQLFRRYTSAGEDIAREEARQDEVAIWKALLLRTEIRILTERSADVWQNAMTVTASARSSRTETEELDRSNAAYRDRLAVLNQAHEATKKEAMEHTIRLDKEAEEVQRASTLIATSGGELAELDQLTQMLRRCLVKASIAVPETLLQTQGSPSPPGHLHKCMVQLCEGEVEAAAGIREEVAMLENLFQRLHHESEARKLIIDQLQDENARDDQAAGEMLRNIQIAHAALTNELVSHEAEMITLKKEIDIAKAVADQNTQDAQLQQHYRYLPR